MGLCYGSLGVMLAELFPIRVRDTGASLTFNLAGIFGASPAPDAAAWLASPYDSRFVGCYLAAAVAWLALSLSRETKDRE